MLKLHELKEAQAFQKAIIENPYDPQYHGVYADWLDEHGCNGHKHRVYAEMLNKLDPDLKKKPNLEVKKTLKKKWKVYLGHYQEGNHIYYLYLSHNGKVSYFALKITLYYVNGHLTQRLTNSP